MAEVYKKFGLDGNTEDFTGHALALYRDDEYVQLAKHLSSAKNCCEDKLMQFDEICSLSEGIVRQYAPNFPPSISIYIGIG